MVTRRRGPTRAPAMILPDPMLLSETATPLGKPGWIYEIKYDGWRLVAGMAAGKVHIRTRGGADYTDTFPEIIEALATLPGGPHILDGEGVVLDENGRSDFNRFQDRALPRRPPRLGQEPVVFMAFDALMIDGQGLIELPVEDRKAALQMLLRRAGSEVRYVDHFPWQHGRALFRQAKALNLEGLVAKKLGSTYQPGQRTANWQKVKVPGAVPAERFKRSAGATRRDCEAAGGPRCALYELHRPLEEPGQPLTRTSAPPLGSPRRAGLQPRDPSGHEDCCART